MDEKTTDDDYNDVKEDVTTPFFLTTEPWPSST